MKTNKAPETLENDLLATHVSDRVNETDAVECKLNEVTLTSLDIQVVAGHALSVLDLWLILLQHEWVGGLNVVVDDLSWKDTTLALRKVEARKLLIHALLVCLCIIDVEDTSGQSGAHLSAVVSIHSQRSALA